MPLSHHAKQRVTPLVRKKTGTPAESLKDHSDWGWARASYTTNTLTKAARDGALATINHALSEGADPNARDSEGRLPLSLACHRGHVECVRTLIEARADVEGAVRRPRIERGTFPELCA